MKKSTIEILLVEDSLAEAGVIREMLAEGGTEEFSVQHVRYLADGLTLLQSRNFDIVLVDLGLPDSQGLETALAVRNQTKQTPIVILTSLDDEDGALEALQQDIQDYLIKGELNGSLLKRSVRYAIRRKHDAEELRFSETRFRALHDDNPTMIWTLDADGRILSTNRASSNQLGYTAWELEGEPALSILHEDDRSAFAEHLRLCLQNPNRPYRWQFRKIRKDGGVLWVEELAQAVYGLQGALNVLVVCQDITERRKAEDKIKRLNAQLAARAVELEDLNRDLEAFNYTAAHDLRKPLTIVNGYCRIIQELCGNNLDEQCAGYLQEAYEGTLRMNRLIDTLLNFSHVSRIEPRREEVDLSDMARTVASELQRTEPARRATFRIAEGISVMGDAGLLQVVLENLLGNAWKYTAIREEAVIEFGTMEIDGGPACFVRDNGPGFAMADAGQLFIPFGRLPGAEKETGFGIGLATVERIIRRHGGRVWAEGEPGNGATFWFTVGSGEIAMDSKLTGIDQL